MIKKNKALIFGGSGFLGGHLCDLLYEKGFNVTVYDLKKNRENKNIKFIKGSIEDVKEIAKHVKKYDYIFNFAGVSDIEKANLNPIKAINQNVIGTVNILEQIKNQKTLKRFIFSSSIYALSTQGGFYSSTKRSCENIIEDYANKYGLKFTILRYGSIYGSRSNSFNALHNFVYQGLRFKKIERDGKGDEI
ncbi:uncharacterized protein METZ01_LOCUS517557, partial [marine metagenome]